MRSLNVITQWRAAMTAAGIADGGRSLYAGAKPG
jgi:hypothetical protein